MKGPKKLLLSMGLALAMLSALLVPVLVPSVALAESDTVSGNVTATGGSSSSLSVTAASAFSFTAWTITGSQVTDTDVQPGDWWTLTDDSGDGLGWQVQIKAASANFTNNNARAYDDNLALDSTLACDKWTLTVLVSRTDATTLALSDDTSEPVSGLYGTSTDGSNVAGSATNIATSDIYLLKAPAEAGMGSYTIKPKLTLQLPASTYSGVYSVDLTLTTTFND